MGSALCTKELTWVIRLGFSVEASLAVSRMGWYLPQGLLYLLKELILKSFQTWSEVKRRLQ